MDQMEQQNAQLMAALEQQKANEMWFEALLRRASPGDAHHATKIRS